MAQVELMAPLGAEFFAGEARLEVAAATLFALVRQLEAQAPGFAAAAQARLSFAVDGAVVSDWGAALGPASRVLVLPRVAGG